MSFAKVFYKDGNEMVMFLDQDEKGRHFFKAVVNLNSQLPPNVEPGVYTHASLVDAHAFASVQEIYYWIDIYGYTFAITSAEHILRELEKDPNTRFFKSGF